MKVYIDNMLVKITKVDRYIANLEEAFSELWQHQMKLNPNKFTFNMILKNFLGYMVT